MGLAFGTVFVFAGLATVAVIVVVGGVVSGVGRSSTGAWSRAGGTSPVVSVGVVADDVVSVTVGSVGVVSVGVVSVEAVVVAVVSVGVDSVVGTVGVVTGGPVVVPPPSAWAAATKATPGKSRPSRTNAAASRCGRSATEGSRNRRRARSLRSGLATGAGAGAASAAASRPATYAISEPAMSDGAYRGCDGCSETPT